MTHIQQLLQKPCMPPSRFQRFAYCHWVVKIDYDGRELSKEIWQWQPHAKSWCKPGNVPTGEANQLLGYIHVALCPYPMSSEETQEFIATLDYIGKRLQQNGGEYVDVSRKEYELIRTSVYESMSMSGVDNTHNQPKINSATYDELISLLRPYITNPAEKDVPVGIVCCLDGKYAVEYNRFGKNVIFENYQDALKHIGFWLKMKQEQNQ